MSITFGDYLIDSGYYDITPEQEAMNDETRAQNAALTADGGKPCDTARVAIAECPNCHNANKYGDYQGPTCDVCGGYGFLAPKEVRCAGCGSPWTSEDLAAARKADPKIISCCPEREPIDIDGWRARALLVTSPENKATP